VAVVAVADGCSQGSSSDVGAGLGARFVAAEVVRAVHAGVSLEVLPVRVLDALTDHIARCARESSVDDDERAHVLADAFLFTVQVAVLTHDGALAFGMGDGVVGHNGALHTLTSVDNAPDYPAYRLLDATALTSERPRAALQPVVHLRCALADVDSVVVGTDGVAELLARAHDVLPDGSALGGVDVFVRDARFVKNRSLASKRLRAWCEATGGAHDDVTLAVLRRMPCA
jgi:hypothetical protein